MTPQHHQRFLSSISRLLTTYALTIPILLLIVGFLIGAGFMKLASQKSAEDTRTPNTVTVLIYDGESSSHSWNGVSIPEGDSVANIIERVMEIERISLSWTGSGRDRQISSLAGKEAGDRTWKTYINNALLPTPIGRFYPRPGDTITVLYETK